MVNLSLNRDGYSVDIRASHMKDFEAKPVALVDGVVWAAMTMNVKQIAKDIRKSVDAK